MAIQFGVQIYLVDPDGKIAVYRRCGGHSIGCYEVPAGKHERTDGSMARTATRECKEETGLTIDVDRFKFLFSTTIPAVNSSTPNTTWNTYVYEVRLTEDEIPKLVEHRTHDEMEMMDPTDLSDLDKTLVFSVSEAMLAVLTEHDHTKG